MRPSHWTSFPLMAGRAITAAMLLQFALVGDHALAANDRDWVAPSLEHLLRMPHDQQAEQTKQATPLVIPGFSVDADPRGTVSTVQPLGATKTSSNPFFQDIGSNGRTCFSCHQPQNGWGISAQSVRQLFDNSAGMAPIFRPVDGAVCPTADFRGIETRRSAYSLLLSKGLIRIALPVPPGAEYAIAVDHDQYGCNSNPATGLVSATSGIVSVYRRPLPATNLGFLTTIMWDGREKSLQTQAVDATIGHAQADAQPSADQVARIVAFESGLLTAQGVDADAGRLNAAGATGGPVALEAALAGFFVGINDPLGGNPTGAPFTSVVFRLYDPWNDLASEGDRVEARKQVARGQALFDTKPIAISGVAGINDTLAVPTLSGFCGTCHSTPNVGNHSVKLPINIGVANAGPFNAANGTGAAPALDIAGLPIFTVSCMAGPNRGATYTVTDLGRAMISGKCADVGKFKGPILRGLAARAPYFHNGSAKTLGDVVDFYDQRFGIGFTPGEKADLVAFLGTL